MVVKVEHQARFRVRVAGNPLQFSSTPAEQFASPPRLGKYTAQVLQELLDYEAARIRHLGPSPVPAFEEE
jgi:crotonobetainyl-CoA:carnitine CoA-transferase CaiB-like acyl-CoA transferase